MKKIKDYQNRIIVDPKILVGKPVIRGTRIPIELILKLLAQGWTNEKILKEYPRLQTQDIQAVLYYVCEIVGNEEVYPNREILVRT